MRISVLVVGALVLACAPATTGSQPTTPASFLELDPADVDVEANEDPIVEVNEILMRVEMENPRHSFWDMADDLRRAGMTESLAIRALAACLHPKDAVQAKCYADRHTDLLVDWLAELGTTRAASVLYAQDTAGESGAGGALEALLERRMAAEAGPCAPPTEAAVDRARASLVGFAVIDGARSGGFVARVPSERELDDLAYFMAAVELAGPEVANATPGYQSGLVPTGEELEQRASWLVEIDEARRAGDFPTLQTRGYAYIESLGYPGEIDMSREGDMTWGGARASVLMRDVALASEVLGEIEVAAALYQRANPGGGMCGTSVGSRWREQIRGFIRTRERADGCRSVVAERLLDIDGRADEPSPYGPARLVDSGFDLARLYRGALLTRNRDLEPSMVLRAIDRAPLAIRSAARARWGNLGVEAWEARVRAIEGLADELGSAGIDLLLAQLDSFAPQLQARALSAIGDAAERFSVEPCDDDTGTMRGTSFGGPPSRTVHMFGTTCATQLDDAAAEALTKRLLPHVDAKDAEVRAAALEAIGEIGSPHSLPRLRRTLARTERALARCQAATPDECLDDEHVRDAAKVAVDHIGELLARS